MKKLVRFSQAWLQQDDPLAIAVLCGRGGKTQPAGCGVMPAQVMKQSPSGQAIVAVAYAVTHRARWIPLRCVDGVLRLFPVLPVHCGERQALRAPGPLRRAASGSAPGPLR